jgi:hypothetical protein
MKRCSAEGFLGEQLLGLWYILGIAMMASIGCIVVSHIAWATGTNRFMVERTNSIARSISRTSLRYACCASAESAESLPLKHLKITPETLEDRP